MFSSKECAGEFLAGVIDGEGSIADNNVTISNTSLHFLNRICEALDTLGITSYNTHRNQKRTLPGRKEVLDLYIGKKENFQILLKWVPLSIPEKRQRLEKIAKFKPRPKKYKVGYL